MRPTILVLCDQVPPGSKAGGSLLSLAGVVAALSREVHTCVVTRDRDLRDDRHKRRLFGGRHRELLEKTLGGG